VNSRNQLFYVYESRRFQKFCSFDCKKVARICFYCEKPILKGGNKYCSSECRRAYYIIVKRCSVCFVEYTTDKKNPNKYCSEACYRKMQSLRQSGSGSHFWKGGMTDWKMRVRTHPLYKLWRKKVFERDGYTCQSCFKKSSEISKGKLTAHHIIPFKEAPKLALKSSNGITLCWQCHKDFHVFLRDGSLALKETSLKEQCLKFFKSEPGVYMFKIHGHNSQASGIPDFIGTVLGFFVAIELKIFPGFASPIQKFQIDRIKNANGKAFVCRSIGEVQKIIQMIKECF